MNDFTDPAHGTPSGKQFDTGLLGSIRPLRSVSTTQGFSADKEKLTCLPYQNSRSYSSCYRVACIRSRRGWCSGESSATLYNLSISFSRANPALYLRKASASVLRWIARPTLRRDGRGEQHRCRWSREILLFICWIERATTPIWVRLGLWLTEQATLYRAYCDYAHGTLQQQHSRLLLFQDVANKKT